MKRSRASASSKYIERSPTSASAVALKTMNGSRVTPKIAGIESTAKRTSLTSITTSTARSGVAYQTPRRSGRSLSGVSRAHEQMPRAELAKYDRPTMSGSESSSRPALQADASRLGALSELRALDTAVYAAIAATPTPTVDRAARTLSRAADHSMLWIGVAGLLATSGERGRRSAVDGLVSIAVTSGIVNFVLKPLRRRRRPDRVAHAVPLARHVDMPRSTSFPSGHAASAFAFASGVAHALPVAAVPLEAAAALVAYTRVHTGVHYPVDVVAGAVVGGSLAPLTTAALDRTRSR